MSKGAEVLERRVIHAGKVFIKAGEENSRAYVIQQGMIRAFVMDGDEKIEVERHGPGTIIGEVCLVLDDPIKINYEAMVDTTVATVTRQDFEKKLVRVDKSIKTILSHLTRKLFEQDDLAIDKARKASEIDEQAYQMVQGMISDMPDERRRKYEMAILPHMNLMIKAIKRLKTEERHSAQTQALEEKLADITTEEQAP